MTTLPDRLEEAEAGSRELDYAIKHWLETNTDDGYWKLRVAADWTTSLDAALALAERVLKDADDRLYNLVVWPSRQKGVWHGPCARVMYQDRDPEAEGGWSTGANDEVHAATPALALCAAILRAAPPAMKGEG